MTTQSRAIVTHGPLADGKWKLEDVKPREIGDTELLVRMVGSGICHTDILSGSFPGEFPLAMYPKVLGHEGSGYVEKVGSKVTVAQPGDPVLLSFAFCGDCELCHMDKPSYCINFNAKNILVQPAFQTSGSSESDVGGLFFGQSSFTSLSIVGEKSVVNVKDVVKSKEELLLFSPLGCGVQTGMGTVINTAGAKAEDSIAIMGLGGVGLPAIMAAKIANCHTIIAIDRVKSRLDLAKSFGATHIINTATDLANPEDLVSAVQSLTKGIGPAITIDTTGVAVLINNGLKFTRQNGQYIQVGAHDMLHEIQLPALHEFLISGKIIKAAIEGDSRPLEFVPKMIQWHKEGKLPLEKITKVVKPEDFAQAIQEMHSGETIKPIIQWS